MIDIIQYHRSELEKKENRMAEIKQYFPTNYFRDEEYIRLVGETKFHEMAIKDYENKIKLGIKF